MPPGAGPPPEPPPGSPAGEPPAGRPSRVPGDRRRELIVAAARESFVEHGYEGARTKEIAERAGTREGVLYRHFSSKEELFEAAVLTPLRDWVTSSVAASAEVSAARTTEARGDALRRANERLAEAVVTITPLLGVALFASSVRGQAFYRDQLRPLLESSFDQTAVAMGDWSGPEFDARFLMLSGFGVYLALALDAHFSGEPVDIGRTAGAYVRLLTHGAMRSPG